MKNKSFRKKEKNREEEQREPVGGKRVEQKRQENRREEPLAPERGGRGGAGQGEAEGYRGPEPGLGGPRSAS